MDYREGICPNCQKTLQIPEDMNKVICMYCGKTFYSKENEAKEEIDVEKWKENACKEFPKLLLSIEDGLKGFKRETYPDAFQEMYKKNYDTLDQIEKLYTIEEGEEILREVCTSMIEEVNKELQTLGKKSAVDRRMMDYNMAMAVYVLPAILEYKGQSSEKLSLELMNSWNQSFKNGNLGRASFEEINAGFRRRLCYITTAVMENLEREEGERELRIVKNYRDHILLKEKGGKELIYEYYDIAPTIVTRINKRKERKEVYQNIHDEYLYPCIRHIEKKEYSQCKNIYVKMVKKLKKEYMGCKG